MRGLRINWRAAGRPLALMLLVGAALLAGPGLLAAPEPPTAPVGLALPTAAKRPLKSAPTTGTRRSRPDPQRRRGVAAGTGGRPRTARTTRTVDRHPAGRPDRAPPAGPPGGPLPTAPVPPPVRTTPPMPAPSPATPPDGDKVPSAGYREFGP